MRILLTFLLILPIALVGQTPFIKNKTRKATKRDIITCPHSGHVHKAYSPPKKYRSEGELKTRAAEFVAVYDNVSEAMQSTMDFVFQTMGEFISSEIPIRVLVRSMALTSEGTLAQASPNRFIANFPGAPYLDTAYPVALAEKLANRHLNAVDEPDLVITINSNANFSIPPNSPSIGTRTDLATVLMHEMIHGLGFTAGSSVSDGNGFLSSIVYSRKLETIGGENLLENFESGTTAMASRLTNNSLYFNAPNLGEERARVYAPTAYSGGSSISHLDNNTYRQTQDRMMVPFIGGGDINYDPGVSVNILHEMGWEITSVIHDPLLFSEDVNDEYEVIAKVNAPAGFDEASFVIHYSTDSFNLVHNTEPLTYNASRDEYSFLLPATGQELQYQYYFDLNENNGTKRLTPARASRTFFTYNLGFDTTDPRIEGHIALSSIKQTDTEFTLKVNEITDFFTGVDTSSLEAIVTLNGDSRTIPFEIQKGEFGDFFEATYRRAEGFELTDELSYQITAHDKSIANNTATLPIQGSFQVQIEEVTAAIVSYTNDFDSATSDFTGSGFRINTAGGFDSPAINSDHPYTNAGADNTLDFIYELKQLIVISDDNPIIKYDEVVIVEPGEEDSKCTGANCDLDFWDYVIVEGQKIGESVWLPFLDGYDCRQQTQWTNAYNNNLNGNPGLYRPKTVRMLQNRNFEVGDEVFIRFRLFSDPFAVGWGWAIDNLEIQPPNTVSTLDEEILDEFKIFPNPISDNGTVTLEMNFSSPFSGTLSLIDPRGLKLIKNSIQNKTTVTQRWDTSRLSTGIYFAHLENELGVSVRKIVIQ